MPTGRENICCRELLKVRDIQGVHCSTEDEDFRRVCLNTAVLKQPYINLLKKRNSSMTPQLLSKSGQPSEYYNGKQVKTLVYLENAQQTFYESNTLLYL